MKKISVDTAILQGLLYVNGPVLLLMFVPLLVVLVFFRQIALLLGSEGDAFAFFCGAFGLGVALAWTWWSYAVPRWRIWAYARVADIATLKARAVQVGLTWPDGHVFERTEFRSPAIARRQRALEKGRKRGP